MWFNEFCQIIYQKLQLNKKQQSAFHESSLRCYVLSLNFIAFLLTHFSDVYQNINQNFNLVHLNIQYTVILNFQKLKFRFSKFKTIKLSNYALICNFHQMQRYQHFKGNSCTLPKKNHKQLFQPYEAVSDYKFVYISATIQIQIFLFKIIAVLHE